MIQKTNIVIDGYYGAGNMGDESILSSILQSIKETYSSSTTIVFSKNPAETIYLHEVDSIFRSCFNKYFLGTKFLNIWKSIRNANLVLIGGGGLLQDVHNNLTIPCFLHTALLAKIMNKPLIFHSIGVGPLNKDISKYIVRSVCNISDLITVRDQYSLKLLESIGVENVPITVVCDPVFGLKPVNKEVSKKILLEEGVPFNKPLVGISLRHINWFKIGDNEILQFLNYLIDIYNVNILFIPFGSEGSPTDMEVSMRIANNMKKNTFILTKKYTPSEMMGIIGHLDFLVGMRLHSLIMSSVMNVPALGICYLPKVKSVMDQLGYTDEHTINTPEQLSFDELKQKFDTIVKNEQNIKKTINECVLNLQEKTIKPADLLLNVKNNDLSRINILSVVIKYFYGLFVLSLCEVKDLFQRIYFNS